jgi:hypothetical protein
MKIDLLYLSDNNYGGWVTYTYHLFHALRLNGADTRIIKFGEKTNNTPRNFGYSLQYERFNTIDYTKNNEDRLKLVVAIQKNSLPTLEILATKDLNLRMVAHDPNEFKFIDKLDPKRIIVIRPSNAESIKGSKYIPHPYLRAGAQENDCPSAWARSVSRVDFDKNTDILLLANRLLPEDKKIDIRGFENRLYTKFKIMPKFPEWVQSKVAFPREKDYAVKLLSKCKFMVDMSAIKNDGGGTQMTFLESADAGAAIVLNSSWFIKKGGGMLPEKNCMTAGTPEELVKVLTKTSSNKRKEVEENAKELLKKHDAKKIGKLYLEWLA